MRPSPAPASTKGIARYHPVLASGTIGISSTIAAATSANPTRMMLAGRRLPALLPAISATANMVRESGARDSPACSAL